VNPTFLTSEHGRLGCPSTNTVTYAKWMGRTPRRWTGGAAAPGGVRRNHATSRSVMQRHRGVSPCGSAAFPGENGSQHLRNGALRVSPLSWRESLRLRKILSPSWIDQRHFCRRRQGLLALPSGDHVQIQDLHSCHSERLRDRIEEEGRKALGGTGAYLPGVLCGMPCYLRSLPHQPASLQGRRTSLWSSILQEATW